MSLRPPFIQTFLQQPVKHPVASANQAGERMIVVHVHQSPDNRSTADLLICVIQAADVQEWDSTKNATATKLAHQQIYESVIHP